MHAFDRQTDRQTEFSSQDRVCIPCSAVKTDNCVTGRNCTAKFLGAMSKRDLPVTTLSENLSLLSYTVQRFKLVQFKLLDLNGTLNLNRPS